MNHFAAFVFLFTFVAFGQATQFRDCGSKTGELKKVEITNCPDGQTPCILKRGTEAQITIDFAAKSDTTSLKAVVHGVIASIPIPFPLPQSDGCKSGISCPIKNGQNYTYINKLSIRNSYPPVSVTIRWELKDMNGDDAVCLEILSKLE